jgi:hypothetical protein
MITIFGLKVTYEVALFFTLFLASEMIGLNPKFKDNSVLGLVVRVANFLKPFRKEDDTIQKAKNSFK